MEQETKQYTCDVCGATFGDMDTLMKHVLIHERSKEKDEIEQGTETPTENPTLPPTIPSPIRASSPS